ncbi:MAG: hypothetical protein K5841_06185 [Fretibacterium sp.]|nr:hypothetical protein [Fretibacterium sp.]
MMKYDVKFFRTEEFQCPCCGQGQTARLLVIWLDLFRAAWGCPVRINSGFRCEKHNVEVGGAARSRHLLGCAADIAPLGNADMRSFRALTRRMFILPGWEVKEYPTFMHVAVPRDEAGRKWGGGAVMI